MRSNMATKSHAAFFRDRLAIPRPTYRSWLQRYVALIENK